MSANDPKVGTHREVEIRLGSDGYFWALPKGRTEPVRDKTLDGLKRKLDNLLRASARGEALNLPAVVLQVLDSYGWDDELDGEPEEEDSGRTVKARWYTGHFVGINAHTGEITFQEQGKAQPTKIDGGHFIRADDPALDTIRGLVVERIRTSQAARKAERDLDAALKRCGYRPSIGYAKNKTEEASRVEQQLIKHLSLPEATP